MDKEKIVQKINQILKNNWRILFEGTLILLLSFFIYSHLTKPVQEISSKEEILKLYEQDRKKDQEVLKSIKKSIDSIHVEQKYVQHQLDGTLESIKKIEKKKNEKISIIRNSPIDSTINFLSNRYNK
jgi:hypothetical protein